MVLLLRAHSGVVVLLRKRRATKAGYGFPFEGFGRNGNLPLIASGGGVRDAKCGTLKRFLAAISRLFRLSGGLNLDGEGLADILKNLAGFQKRQAV
jgi:hypothetical protein